MMDPELFGKLLDRYLPALVLYARQWTAAPEDVVQEAFLKLMRQRQSPLNVVPWLYRVVRNAAIDAARANQRRQRGESAAARTRATWFQPAEGGDLDAEEATQALQALPLEQREVLLAHLWGGLTFEQIAEVAGCSSSTAHRRYLQGLESLRERYHVSCPTDETR